MKLLLDQNLSRRLVISISALWPDSSHVMLCGLNQSSDKTIWDFAAKHDYCIVSKDSDFLHMALLHGFPPKVIIINSGNTATSEIERILLTNEATISIFLNDASESALVLP